MWSSHRGRPADQPPTPEQVHQWHRRIAPPDNEFPAGVGLTVLLGHTDDAAVGITAVEAFTTGFRFTLAVRLRRARPGLAPGGPSMLLGAHHHPGITIPLEERLLLGVEYPDGRRASTVQDLPMPGPDAIADDRQLVLAQQSGGGDDLSVDHAYRVAPRPGEGPVTFVLAWPAFGPPETHGHRQDSTPVDGGHGCSW